LEHCKKDTFIIFDIDNTILGSEYLTCTLFSNEGVTNFNNCLMTSENDLPFQDRLEIRNLYCDAMMVKQIPVEKFTIDVILTLQKGGAIVFGLTARDKSSAKKSQNNC